MDNRQYAELFLTESREHITAVNQALLELERGAGGAGATAAVGAILDAVSAGLRNYDNVKLGSLPRMARSARWIAACETCLPEGQGNDRQAHRSSSPAPC